MDQRPKRQVSYNEEAILCPACTKRVRLNNNGLVRKHMSGKLGSPECIGSNYDPHAGKPANTVVEPVLLPEPLFSDIA